MSSKAGGAAAAAYNATGSVTPRTAPRDALARSVLSPRNDVSSGWALDGQRLARVEVQGEVVRVPAGEPRVDQAGRRLVVRHERPERRPTGHRHRVRLGGDVDRVRRAEAVRVRVPVDVGERAGLEVQE